MNQHFIVWFEIPTIDIERAATFYSQIFGVQIVVNHNMSVPMAFFPSVEGGITGSLIKYESYQPSATDGPLVYLNGGEDLDNILNKVEVNGGKVIQSKSQISPDVGYMGIFIDTEGNRIALHSKN